MPFELKIDFAGLIAFVSNTRDPEDATLWNAILVNTAMEGMDMEEHYPMLVFPGDCLDDDDLPDGHESYRSLPPVNGIPMIGLPINGLKLSFSPVQTGLKNSMQQMASLESAAAAGLVKKGVFDTLDVIRSVGANVELQGGELFGSQSPFMQGKTFAFTDDNDITPYDYRPVLCDQARLFQFRTLEDGQDPASEDGLTVKFEVLKYEDDPDDKDYTPFEINLIPVNGSLPLIVTNLPWESQLSEDYHREHFKHYYDLSDVPLGDKDRPMPIEIDSGGGQSGKLVFCITGVMYSE